MKLLVANRGEIAIRILRGASELDIPTVAIYPADDAASLHTGKADEAVEIPGVGTAAYLDIDAIIGVAKDTGANAIHPGYGFLAENADLARACTANGITFVGPSAEMLELFGDKARARAAASEAGVPIIRGIDHAVSLEEAQAFFASLGAGSAMMIKAIGGGGGRGSRRVTSADDVAATYERCRTEAEAAFGNGDVYVEEFIQRARHIEVQILGDQHGSIVHLAERECSIQRHFQKILEVAPAPNLETGLRDEIIAAAVKLASHVGYASAGTFEFLIDTSGNGQPFAFIEANARLQVEHTVTEEVTGIDIVKAQLAIAEGATLEDAGLEQDDIATRGYAIQARVCMETVREDGSIVPTSGTLSAYEAPSGPGIRTDGFGYAGYQTSLLFDSLLAKVIGYSPSKKFTDAITRTERALAEFRIEGVETNIPFLRTLLARPEFADGSAHTRFIDENATELARAASAETSTRYTPAAGLEVSDAGEADDSDFPTGPEGSVGLGSPIQGTIVAIDVGVGETVRTGQPVAVVEAMKLQHDIKAERGGLVVDISMSVGDVVREGFPIVFVEESDDASGAVEAGGGADLDLMRDDMREYYAEVDRNLDDAHEERVAALRDAGRRTARENIADLLDDGSFREFGPAASGSAAGGTIIGMGSINADLFGDDDARVALIHNNYDISTTTNGAGHYKQEPVHELVHDFQVPLVLFSEGEGKPYVGSRGFQNGVGMDGQLFTEFARLSGLVPLVGVSTGNCFGPNATLLACCDTIIATKQSAIGMGAGPSVMQAAGLGSYSAQEIGGSAFQAENGDIDILVDDDAAAIAAAKQYLSYFQGNLSEWEAPDQRRMRHIIPENRVRTYDMREIMYTLADEGSVLELRRDFGIGVITALIRVEGRPMGLVANNPAHLAGAVDSPGADKGARFMQLADAFDLPVVVFMDCPGIMVGPDHERTALVRHAVRMFNVGSNISTAMFGVMVRKAYGLGVQAMCAGSAMIPLFNVAWPTAEFAGMNIDGAVKLSARRELMAIEDPEERKAAYDKRVADGYENARAINSGARYVIDPADTRAWVVRGLKSLPPKAPREGKRRPYVDTW